MIAKEAHGLGYIDSPDSVKSMNLDEANVVIPHGSVFLGTNGQGQASRARKLLGWEPNGESFHDAVRETIIAEAAQLWSLARSIHCKQLCDLQLILFNLSITYPVHLVSFISHFFW